MTRDEPDGLDAVADELYGGDPADFVRLRTERAAAAKAAGERELARAITALRKPTATAALVNRLAREQSGPLGELADIGARLRTASRTLSGTELREVAARRTELINTLLGTLPGAGHDAAREVETTLNAVLADADVAGTVLAGRLSKTAGPVADLGWLAAAVPTDHQPATRRPPRSRPLRAVPDPVDPDDPAQRQRAEEHHRQCVAELDRARQHAEDADTAVRTLAAQLDEARRARDRANTELRRAEATARKAATAVNQPADPPPRQ